MSAALPVLLVLWDVDHTLIENGGVSKATYLLAYELLTGRRPTVPPETDGRTDVAIMESLLQDNGREPADFARAPLGGTLRGGRAEQTRARPARACPSRCRPGAEATGRRHPDRAVGPHRQYRSQRLGQARNLRPGRTPGLRGRSVRCRERHALSLGGCGSGQGAKKYSFDPEKGVTVLIGDTPLDVQAGVDGGARVIGVASGATSEQALRDAGADATLPDLTNADALLAALEECRKLGPRQPAQAAGS